MIAFAVILISVATYKTISDFYILDPLYLIKGECYINQIIQINFDDVKHIPCNIKKMIHFSYAPTRISSWSVEISGFAKLIYV